MNIDLKTIYDEIKNVEKEQATIHARVEERHAENKETINVIFKKLKKLDDLPCEVHVERMKLFSVGIKCLWVLTLLILGWIIAGKVTL